MWHSGDARAAIAKVEGLTGLRASSLRGRAAFDLGDHAKARAELDAALVRAPDSRSLAVWLQAAKLASVKSSSDRKKAEEELNRLALQSASKAARYPAGVAFIRLGRLKNARFELESSLEDLSAETPNGLEYRSNTALARVELASGKIGEANNRLTRALELNPGYLAAHDLMGQILVASDKKRALEDHLKMVVGAEMSSAAGDIAYAKALLPLGNKTDRAAAVAALKRAKAKGASDSALRETIESVDEGLFDELGVSKK